MSCPRHCTCDSDRARTTRLPRKCFRPCARSSAGTSSCRVAADPYLDVPLRDRAMLDRLAARAVALTRGADVIGLGSGHAAATFIRALGAEVKAGRAVRGVP